jgi:uncharacterized membrane protein YdjX (TVP38/TMEM64 family)
MRRIERKWIKLLLFVAGLAAVAVSVRASGLEWSEFTPQRLRELLLSFGWWAPLIYTLVLVQPIVPLPASIVLMAGGLSFGILAGFLISLSGTTLRGCGQFLIAKMCGREAVQALLRGRLAEWDRGIGRHGFWTVFWLRVIPGVPFDFQNFGLGLSNVSFGSFAPATLLGLIPGVFLWVYLGHTLTDPRHLWKIAGVLLGLLALWVLRSRLRSASAQRAAAPCSSHDLNASS